MPRVKTGVTKRHRHNKVLAMTRGHRASKHSLYRRAHESMMHSLSYAQFHRRERKADMRRLWICRINAACKAEGVSYSELICGLKKGGLELNRKMLADMAVKDAASFARLVQAIQTN